MSMMARFTEIMSYKFNSLVDNDEDLDKLLDQYVRKLNKDLAKVKSETESVLAEEQRSKRAINECQVEIEKMERYAQKSLEAGNERDARMFLEKKETLTAQLSELQASYQWALSNSLKMKQIHDKLVADLKELKCTKESIENERVLDIND